MAGEPNNDRLTVLDHPLVEANLARLRNKQTGPGDFRNAMAAIASLLTVEATRRIATRAVDIETPVAKARVNKLPGPVIAVPILRAGQGLLDGVLSIVPDVRVGHIGMARDETTLKPTIYMQKLPPLELAARPVLLLDPMLATGGSAIGAARLLREAGATDIKLLCAVASPVGLRNMSAADPAMEIYAAAMDETLDDRGFILPGLGDAGDRLYGTD